MNRLALRAAFDETARGRRAYYQITDARVAELVVLAHALAADNHTALCACHRITEAETTDT